MSRVIPDFDLIPETSERNCYSIRRVFPRLLRRDWLRNDGEFQSRRQGYICRQQKAFCLRQRESFSAFCYMTYPSPSLYLIN